MVALDIDAPFNYIKTASNYQASARDVAILCDASSSVITVTLPPLAGTAMGHKIWVVKNAGSHTVTVTSSGSDSMNGDGAVPVSLPGGGTHTVTLISAGFTWLVLGLF